MKLNVSAIIKFNYACEQVQNLRVIHIEWKRESEKNEQINGAISDRSMSLWIGQTKYYCAEKRFLFLTGCVMNVDWLSWSNRHIRQLQIHSSQSILPNNFKRFNSYDSFFQLNLLSNSLQKLTKENISKKRLNFSRQNAHEFDLMKGKKSPNDLDAITIEPFWIHSAIRSPKLL